MNRNDKEERDSDDYSADSASWFSNMSTAFHIWTIALCLFCGFAVHKSKYTPKKWGPL